MPQLTDSQAKSLQEQPLSQALDSILSETEVGSEDWAMVLVLKKWVDESRAIQEEAALLQAAASLSLVPPGGRTEFVFLLRDEISRRLEAERGR